MCILLTIKQFETYLESSCYIIIALFLLWGINKFLLHKSERKVTLMFFQLLSLSLGHLRLVSLLIARKCYANITQ